MWHFLSQRRRTAEWMDEPDADAHQVRQSLRFLDRINGLLGYRRSTLRELERFSRNWTPGRPVTVLDVATGAADMPRAILHWADRRGLNVRSIGLDLHPTIAAAAKKTNADGRLHIVRGDALALPFADGSIDYVVNSLFLHHLDEPVAIAALREMARVARRGIVVGDLLRHRRAYVWIKLLSLLANPMVRHDGPASVAQAFTRAEILAIRDQAGVDFAHYRRCFGHRFILAGEKTTGDGGRPSWPPLA